MTKHDETTREDFIAELADTVFDTLYIREIGTEVDRIFNVKKTKELRSCLDGYSTALLREANAVILDNEGKGAGHTTAHMLASREPEDIIRGYWYFQPMMIPNERARFSTYNVFESFRLYPELQERIDNNQYRDDHTTAQCYAIMHVVLTISNQYIRLSETPLYFPSEQRVPVLFDRRLSTFLLENPDKVTRVADIIIDRHSADYDIIKLALETATPLLAKGVL